MAKSLEEIEKAFQEQHKTKVQLEEVIEEDEESEILRRKEQDEKPKLNHASIVSDVIFYLTLIAMVICAVLFSRGALGTQTFGGYRFYEVMTTSMESVYPRGSLLLIKETDSSNLVVGDDITFAVDSSNIITHRIVEIQENYEGSGTRAFITKGVDNVTEDQEPVPSQNVIGVVKKGIPRLGAALSWLGSNLWVLLIFFLSLVAFSFFIKLFFREGRKSQENTMEGALLEEGKFTKMKQSIKQYFLNKKHDS